MASVFLCHRGPDLQEAERLALELQQRGHEVWLDVWKIGVGDSVIELIDEGLRGSAYILVCYSTATCAAWMNREWMSALARQLDGAAVKLIPVRLTGDDSPAILADIKYADLVTDWQLGVDMLCSVLR